MLLDSQRHDYADFLRRFQEDPNSISADEAARRYRELMSAASLEDAAAAHEQALAQIPSEARHSLLMSAFVKIPLQVLVLLVGVFMFLYYVFHQPPMLFNAQHRDEVEHSARAGEFHALQADFERAFAARRCTHRTWARSPASE